MSIKYKKFESTQYVMKMKKGQITRRGAGLSFFYNTMTTSMIVIPMIAFDDSFAFDDIMTSDFQSVGVQGDISYMVKDYEQAAKMVDFSYKSNEKDYQTVLLAAKQKMAKRITNLAKVYITKFISQRNIRKAIVANDELAMFLQESMREDKTIEEFGIQLVSISILGIFAKPETKKALEAAAREEILKMQDDAIYKRRNAAIEQERLVKENELNTEIKVAQKEKEKREKEMETKRMIQQKQAEMDEIEMQDKIKLEEEKQKLVDLEIANEKKKSDAKAYDSEALLKTFMSIDPEIVKALVESNMDSKALIAKAFAGIGDNADKIGTLNISPDLLDTLTK